MVQVLWLCVPSGGMLNPRVENAIFGVKRTFGIECCMPRGCVGLLVRVLPKGYKCAFRTLEVILYGMVQISSLCVPSCAMFASRAGNAISDSSNNSLSKGPGLVLVRAFSCDFGPKGVK